VFTYARMRSGDLLRSSGEEPVAGKDARIIDGLRYLWNRSDLLLPILVMAVIGMIGFNFPVTLAALAKIDFHAGPSSFGLLTTCLAAGSLCGALAGSGRRGRPSAYVVIGAGAAFGLLEFVVGFAPSFVVAMILLVPTGFFSVYLAQAANQRVQMGVHGQYRGRVMAIYILVFLGTTPIGASLAGWWGERFGVPSSIWAAGLVSFSTAVVALVWQLRSSGRRLTDLRMIRSAPVEAEAVPEPASRAA
jgi:MFS family permease